MSSSMLNYAPYGFPVLSEHAADRIRERFGAASDEDALIWVVNQMRQVQRLTCKLHQDHPGEWAVVWHCPHGVRLVRIGDLVVTVYVEGEADEDNTAA